MTAHCPVFGTSSSITSGGLKLLVLTQTSPLTDLMRIMQVLSTCQLDANPAIWHGFFW
jgi:hypothetical protein